MKNVDSAPSSKLGRGSLRLVRRGSCGLFDLFSMFYYSAQSGLAAQHRPSHRRVGSSPSRRGMTLIEVMISMVILTMCCGMLTSTLTTTRIHRSSNAERAVAVEAVRGVLEDMHNWNFGAVFTTYNADPLDDPEGEGTAPGCYFEVEGLSPTDDDEDGFVGEIYLPSASLPLREDAEISELGMPRDLNGDRMVDTLDHGDDHIVLPVRVVVRWKGVGGVRSFEMSTILADLEKLR